jgi:hypothetical protein
VAADTLHRDVTHVFQRLLDSFGINSVNP